MRTNQPNSSSLVFLLATVVTLLFAGAHQALAQQQRTVQDCIDQWRASAEDCCGWPQEERPLCWDVAHDELVECLTIGATPPRPARNKCRSIFDSIRETYCRGPNAPCNNVEGRKQCRRMARTIFRWCIGLDPDIPMISITPRWEQYPTSVKVGDNYLLTVTTDDPAVDRVRFFAIRMDAPETAADPVFEIGNAGSTPLGGNAVRWSLTTDTGTWPLENGEERVIIFARSETFTSPTATQILDISTLIEVEIEQ